MVGSITSTKTVVLCGGLGTRVSSVLGSRPKAMAPVAGRPFLEWLLLFLRSAGITEVTLATGFGADTIRRYVGDGSRFGLRVTESWEPAQMGTGPALIRALGEQNDGRVLVVNGDTAVDVDVTALLAAHERGSSAATVCVTHATDTSGRSKLGIAPDGRITSLACRGAPDVPGWVGAGFVLLDVSEIRRLAPPVSSFGIDDGILRQLVEHRLHAFPVPGPIVDIGTPEALSGAARAMAAWLSRIRAQPGTAVLRQQAARISDTAALLTDLREECLSQVDCAAGLIASAFASGDKLLLCGNGGSAADCQHLAAEFVHRLSARLDRPALPAIALTTDTSVLTAISNDRGYEHVFERQVAACGREGDVLVAISASGRSPSLLLALAEARRRGLHTITLTGEGGTMPAAADIAVEVPSRDTQLVQEVLLPLEHSLCALVEARLVGRLE